MTEKLPEYKKQLEELDAKLASEAVLSDMKQYKALMQERSHLAPVIEKMEEIIKLEEEIEGSKEMIKSESDPELVEMAKEEIAELEEKRSFAQVCACVDELYPDAPMYGILIDDRKSGLCQFRTSEPGEILLLRSAVGVVDPQSLVLALRGALFFMDKLGIKEVVCLDSHCRTVAQAVGFCQNKLSLEGFFERKCGFSADSKL